MCPLVDHGQQSLKMHTEVTLLYNAVLPLTNPIIKVLNGGQKVFQIWNYYFKMRFAQWSEYTVTY